jgi:hypothetical protein
MTDRRGARDSFEAWGSERRVLLAFLQGSVRKRWRRVAWAAPGLQVDWLMRTTLPFGVPPSGFIQAQATDQKEQGKQALLPPACWLNVDHGWKAKTNRVASHDLASCRCREECRRRPPPTGPVLLFAPVRPVLLMRCRRMVLSLVRRWSDRGGRKERTDDVSRCLTGVREARREWPWARKLERFRPDQSLRPHQFVTARVRP